MDLHRGTLHADNRLHTCRAVSRALSGLMLLVLFPTGARAQISVEAAPLRIELQASAGSVATQAVTVWNSGKETVRVRREDHRPGPRPRRLATVRRRAGERSLLGQRMDSVWRLPSWSSTPARTASSGST